MVSNVPDSYIQIDRPAEFHGTLDFHPIYQGQVMLMALQGDHRSYHNDMLDIFDTGRLVQRLHVTESNGAAFDLQQTSKGIALVSAITQADHGAVIHLPTV